MRPKRSSPRRVQYATRAPWRAAATAKLEVSPPKPWRYWAGLVSLNSIMGSPMARMSRRGCACMVSMFEGGGSGQVQGAHGVLHALGADQLQMLRQRGLQRGIAGQVVAKDGAHAQQGRHPCSTAAGHGGRRLQWLGQRVGEAVVAAGFILPRQVAEPARQRKADARMRQPGGAALAQRAQQALGDLLRAIHGDLLQAVLERRIAEALHQLRPVGRQSRSFQGRFHFLGQHGGDELFQLRVLHGAVHGLVADQCAQVGQCRVAAIEHAQLGVLVGRGLLDHRHAGVFPAWTRAAETVFQHPLAEALGHHRPGVFHAQAPGHMGQVIGAGLGHDAVDHGIGEGHLRGNPLCQRRLQCGGKSQHHAARGIAIGRQVVARHHGEGRQTRAAAAQQRMHDETDGAARLGRAQVVFDIGMVQQQGAAGRVVAVTLFGDGQADDVAARIGHGIEHCLRRLGGDQRGQQGTGHLQAFALGVTDGHGVEMVLRGQGVTRVGGAQGDADDAPAQVAGGDGGFSVERLVGAMEGAQAQVDDARLQPAAVIGGQGERVLVRWRGAALGQRGQLCLVQSHGIGRSMERLQPEPNPAQPDDASGRLRLSVAGAGEIGVTRHGGVLQAPAAREFSGHAFEVGAHGAAGSGRVMGGDGFEDATVVGQRGVAQFIGVEVLVHLAPQATALVPQALDHLHIGHVAGGAGHRQVEGAVGFLVALAVAVEALHVVDGVEDGIDGAVGGHAGGDGGDLALDQLACRQDLEGTGAGLVHVGGDVQLFIHVHARTQAYLDDAAQFQRNHGLAYQGAAHVQAGCQFALGGQAAAGGDLLLADDFLDALGDDPVGAGVLGMGFVFGEGGLGDLKGLVHGGPQTGGAIIAHLKTG
eukprot:TRINITY_DN652_c1_g5_i1.p1 TRINITY_DN652_c1_g5~~TRINITY_DN652_c1_g5_i1.p1  ORF type:complete len:870 (-),score=339.47 TRINITY_DN652_c1_g5_i1:20-2629(-)